MGISWPGEYLHPPFRPPLHPYITDTDLSDCVLLGDLHLTNFPFRISRQPQPETGSRAFVLPCFWRHAWASALAGAHRPQKNYFLVVARKQWLNENNLFFKYTPMPQPGGEKVICLGQNCDPDLEFIYTYIYFLTWVGFSFSSKWLIRKQRGCEKSTSCRVFYSTWLQTQESTGWARISGEASEPLVPYTLTVPPCAWGDSTWWLQTQWESWRTIALVLTLFPPRLKHILSCLKVANGFQLFSECDLES